MKETALLDNGNIYKKTKRIINIKLVKAKRDT